MASVDGESRSMQSIATAGTDPRLQELVEKVRQKQAQEASDPVLATLRRIEHQLSMQTFTALANSPLFADGPLAQKHADVPSLPAPVTPNRGRGRPIGSGRLLTLEQFKERWQREITEYCNANGCNPKKRTLAHLLGISLDTLRRYEREMNAASR